MYYDLSSFGKKLIEMRQAIGYSQKRTSELSGVHIETLRKIENGKVIPKQETLDFLSTAYKKNLNVLLLKCKYNDYSKFNDIKNRMESKLDKDEFYTLGTELDEFRLLLSNTENSYVKTQINQLILLIESVMLNKGEHKRNEALDKLIEALEIGNLEFTIFNYNSYVYSSLEIRILMNIALILNKIESAKKSLEILSFCYENVEPDDNVYSKVCYNLSYAYHRVDCHKNALKYSSLGIEYCIQNRDFNGLNLLYFREGIAKFLLKHDNYIISLRKALAQTEILEQYELRDSMIRSCKKNYNIDL